MSGGSGDAGDGRLRLRVERVPGPPVVAVRVAISGGARVETVPGRALLAGRLLTEGTRRREFAALADLVEAHGMLLTAGGTFESHGLALDALADDWPLALELAAEMTFEAAFPGERVAWLRRQTAAELESLGDRPEVRTAWGFLDQIYHPHRRALPLQGTTGSLALLTPEDCAAFHHRALSRGATVVVTGDVRPEAVEERARELFSRLPEVAEPEPASPAPVGRDERHLRVDLPPPEAGEPAQAHLYAGHLTVARGHDDYDALDLAGIVLGAGAGLTGRIPERIREREGLAYAATAATTAGAGLDPGRLVLYVGTNVDTVEQAEAGVRQELARFVDEGPTEAEVDDSRAYLVGRQPFRRETARQIADLVVRAEHYGLPVDRPGWREERLQALTRDAVHAAVRRHLRPDDLRVTVGIPRQPAPPG